ncbi:MAG: hypothetical protein WD607_04790 [Candidatus Paceibacterota bacterium]
MKNNNLIKKKDVLQIKASILGQHFLECHKIKNDELIKVYAVDPKKLLHYKRIDIIPKIRFAEDFLKSSWRSRTIEDYKKIISCFSFGKFQEPGDPYKNSFESYLDKFKELINNISMNGFNTEKSVIPVGENGIIIDGSHRVAAAIALNKKVAVAYFPNIKVDYGVDFFRKRGLEEEDIEAFILDYMARKEDHQTFLLWSKLSKKERKQAVKILEEQSGGIIYKQTYNIKFQALMNLVALTYEGDSWVGNPDNKFAGAERKAHKVSRGKTGDLTMVIVDDNTEKHVSDVKKYIRTELKCENDGCHSTDSYKESSLVAQYLLNSNTRHMLSYGKPFHYPKLVKRILRFRKNIDSQEFDREDFIIDSSTVLGLYGLRLPNDLNFLSLEKEFKNVENYEIKNHHHGDDYYPVKRRDLITDSRNYIYFMGLKIISLPILIEGNKLRRQSTKHTDIKLAKIALNRSFRERLIYLRFIGLLQRIYRVIKIKLMYPVYLRLKKVISLIKK